MIQTIGARTLEAVRLACREADGRADILELRMDLVRDRRDTAALDRLLAERGRPRLFTMRSRPQGGEASPGERESLLSRALAAGIEYIDLEYDGPDLSLLGRCGRSRPIVSWHDMAGTPLDLPALHVRMRAAAPGAILKIVTWADAAGDNLRLRDLLRGASPGTLIAFAMGPKGIPSRVLAPAWGSAALYAPARSAPATAPGQVPLEDLFDLYRIDRIGPRTRLLGVLAHPVGHSLSPLLHNAALARLGLDYVYLPFEARTIGEFLPLFGDLPIAGLSVTLPHKESILPHLDGTDPVARAVGSVNTVLKTWNRIEGHNTDVEAALLPLRAVLDLKGARVAVLGAGGAARALAWGLRREGSDVTVFNRTAARARILARALAVRWLPWSRLRGFRCDLLINATPVGMAPRIRESPLPAGWARAPNVYDLVYNPPETRLLREARARGARTIRGGEMFVAQAEAQFRLFTGRDAPAGLMRRALDGALVGAPRSAKRRPVQPARAPRRRPRRP